MRVLQVVTDTDRRGAQVFATDLHTAMRDAGVDVRTVALAKGTVGGLDMPVLGPSRTDLRTGLALRHVARRADVVIAHGSTTLPMCALWLAGSTPFIYRQISDSLFWAPSAASRLRVRLGMARAARVIALWGGARDTLVEHFGVHAGKVDVVPNGVPASRFPPITDEERSAARLELGLRSDGLVVLYAGALVAEKGVDLAIDAVAGIPDTMLLIVGDGPERETLAAAAGAGLGEQALLLPTQGDMQAVYAAADVLVLPSRGGDSMPAVLIEAALRGVPCISTPVGAIPEVLCEGAGVVVPVGDAMALRIAVQQLLDDPAHRHAVIKAAHRRALKQYEINAVAGKYIEGIKSAKRMDRTRPPSTFFRPSDMVAGDR